MTEHNSTQANTQFAHGLTPEERNRIRAREWARANKERNRARVKAWQEANPERVKALRKAYRERNREKISAAAKLRRLANPEKVKAQKAASAARYYQKNKEKVDAYSKEWAEKNRAKRTAAVRARDAAKLQRTPLWADPNLTAVIYFAASLTGAEVDHIVPLRGKKVCGLHWHHNLQLLSPEENRRKHANFNPDTYVHELPRSNT